MSEQQSDTSITDAVKSIDQSESVKEIQQALAQARKRLKSTPDDGSPVERARALLDVAEPQLGLGQGRDAWMHAREAFSVFVDYEQWQDAAEAADILYQCEQPDSIAALGQGAPNERHQENQEDAAAIGRGIIDRIRQHAGQRSRGRVRHAAQDLQADVATVETAPSRSGRANEKT